MVDKEVILNHALMMFNVNGIKPVTMDNISMDLKISKRTLYEIFDNKDDVVEQVMDYDITHKHEEIKEIIRKTDNIFAALSEIVEKMLAKKRKMKQNPRFYEDLKKYYPATYAQTIKRINEDMFNTVFKLIERGKLEGYFKKEIDTEIIISTIIVIVKATQNGSYDLSKTTRNFFDTLVIPYLIGISTESGRELLDNQIKSIKGKETK
ncbi:MAG: TetR/AcrR family transcriptional regulator [Bacteroidales bacterium]|nr:TetR/AcrR family transcriptional regulator [Bacteroidales bacterium]